MPLKFLQRVRSWRIRRRLRRIANIYWQADAEKDSHLVSSYMNELACLRSVTGTGMPQEKALHVGSGGHTLIGWINADIIMSAPTDIVFDIAEGFPFKSESFQWIHSEDLLEHLDQDTGRLFATEAFRVLKPGGVMRILTPDLYKIVKSVYLSAQRHHIEWCGRKLGAGTPCEALNMHMRMNGAHRFLYDRDQLRSLLKWAGFQVRLVKFGQSTHRELCNIDLRNFHLSLYFEAIRAK